MAAATSAARPGIAVHILRVVIANVGSGWRKRVEAATL
jgi:hypothetical protein